MVARNHPQISIGDAMIEMPLQAECGEYAIPFNPPQHKTEALQITAGPVLDDAVGACENTRRVPHESLSGGVNCSR